MFLSRENEPAAIIIPRVLFFILIMMFFLRFPFRDFELFMPRPEIIFLFYWQIYRPQVISFWLLIAGGILIDCINLQVIGATSLSLYMCQLLLRRYKYIFLNKPLIITFLGFAVFAAIYFCLLYGWNCLFLTRIYPVEPLIIKYFSSFINYFWLHYLFNIVYKSTSAKL